jgi:hypothetical protein
MKDVAIHVLYARCPFALYLPSLCPLRHKSWECRYVFRGLHGNVGILPIYLPSYCLLLPENTVFHSHPILEMGGVRPFQWEKAIKSRSFVV